MRGHDNCVKIRQLDTLYPGHIIGMDMFYVGCLKGVGRIFQFTAIDTYSSYGWAKLHTDKSAVNACDFLMHVYNNSLDVPIQSVLTDNGKEFTTHHPSKNHSFERLAHELAIKHRLTKVRHPWTNGACERLNRTVLEEFYQVAHQCGRITHQKVRISSRKLAVLYRKPDFLHFSDNDCEETICEQLKYTNIRNVRVFMI